MIRDNHYFLLLEKLYRDSPELSITKKDKIVIFSDLHMGDGRSLDDFHRNSKLFLTALNNFYFDNNYILILNGDVEELHRYKLSGIKNQWKEIYEIFCRFQDKNRLYKIYGNHDSKIFGYKESELGCLTLKSLILKLKDKELFIYHGHQASFYYNTFDDIMSLALKFVAVPLRIKSYSVAHNNMKKSHIEKMAYDFARSRKMSLYNNRYRIESARLNNWNYSSNGYYYITICTKNRKHLFGEIKQNEMQLSEIGKIVLQYWQEIPNHFPSVKLDEFIFMPDHMHGIILIGDHEMEVPDLGIIINQYKRKCTIESRKIDPTFSWLPRFHDHIIRNNGDLNRIRDYIQNNPRNWEKDNLYTG